MAAVASAPQQGLDAAMNIYQPTASPSPSANQATDASAQEASATTTAPPSSTQTQAPPHLLLRLPPQPESDSRQNPLKRKWRSLVNFFALPIREYYLEPPGAAYRAELRARRGHIWNENDAQPIFWPVPAYTDQVGDDEMVLFKAHEEAEALAAMQRDQQQAAAAAAATADQHAQNHDQDHAASPEFNDTFTDGGDDEEDEEGPASTAAMWPQTPPEAGAVQAFQTPIAEPSPRYELTDPLSALPLPPLSIPASQPRGSRIRTRTSSNLSPIVEPSFSNGVAMSRHLSTPLSPTVPASPPSASSGLFARRNRAHTNATRPTLGGRNISEPLSWTLVRSQYSYPKRGLTAEQMAFLSSVESLGRFGVPHSPNGAASIAPSPAYDSMANDYGFPLTGAQP